MTERLDDEIFGKDQPCYGCSPTHPHGFRLKFERDEGSVTARYTPTELVQGPPGLMHGGLVIALADEIAAWTIIGMKERLAFTAAVDARLRGPVRIGVEVVARGHITQDGGRVIKVDVELRQEGVHVFQGAFKFALLDRTGAERVLGRELPEAWKRFCR
ncbi:MAG TPA: PaaI family thioesterase [Byssovorax sp.]|jgi:acyl-coenzyme A thioesterase PaaI-like protein